MAKSRFLSTLFVALFVVCNYAVELEEIKPWEVSLRERRGLERRDTTVFDLRSAETFLWGAGGGGDAVWGNLTVMMPGNDENILSMERFHGNLKSVQCEATKMTLTFQDDETFDYATKVWDWVNGAANRTFVIVASKGNCGNNEFRVPYKVNALDHDKSSHIATLHASVETWKDIAHTYEMRVGSLDIPDTILPALVRRDITKSTSIDLGVDFSFTGKIGVASLKCSPCSTAGKLDFEFIIKQDWFVPVGVEFRAQPQGLELKAGVTVTGSFGVSKTGTNTSDDRIPLIQYPLPGGVSIPGGIFSLGPQLVAELGWEFTATQVSILVKTGATVTFSDNAILQADLLDLTQNKFSGWVPHVTFDPLQIQAQESLKLQVYVAPSIELEAEALGQGVEAGIMLKAPYVQVEGDVIDSLNNGGACTAGDGKEFALKLVPSWGVQIDLQAGSIKGKDVTVSLATASFPWPGLPSDWCWAFDDPNNNNGNPNPSNPAPTLPASSPNPSPGPGVNTCTVNGRSGTCIDSNACTNGGKVATPGYCPDDPSNVQCCTTNDSTPPSANSCSVNGNAGTCLDTTACKNSGKAATPGYCPDDPADVQCCTTNDSTPPSANSCSVNGNAGTCLDTTSCKNSGKVATPGYCPNDPANVQCCTSADTSSIGKIIYSVGGLGQYPVTDDVNCRSGPGTSFDVQKTYPKGQDVSVTCQAPGTNVNDDTLWDKTTDGCYVSDYYVHTGTSNYVTAKCDDSTAAHVYAVKDDVNCRSGPGTSFDVQKTYPKGQDVTLTCQAPGTNINDDTLWDKTTDGCYVADWYVQTGTSNYVTAKCDDSSGSSGGSGGSGGSGSCGAPHSNQATIDLIAEFEGFVSQVYNDPTGHPTIGYGHLCKNTGCSEIGFPIPLSEADGKKLLAQDLTQFEQCITDMTNEKATINMNEYGALVSWSYNVGCGAAKSSTLIERLNNGEDPKVVLSSELPQWDKSDGQVLSGLLRRRNAEIALAQTPTSDPALPVKC